MKNHDFIKSRQEILICESLAFAELPEDKILKTMDGRILHKDAGIQFVNWKQQLLDLIKNSDELALKMRLFYLKSKLCRQCRKGLKDSICKHPSEYETFIACQYISGALI